MGYSPWGLKELDGTEQLTLSLFFPKTRDSERVCVCPNASKFTLRGETSRIRPTLVSIFVLKAGRKEQKLYLAVWPPVS